jgi:hypothetical protein
LIISFYPVAQWYRLCKQLNTLATQVNPPSNYNVALKSAILRARPEIVEILLQDPRFDPSVRNNEALRLAADRRHRTIVQMLIQD